MKYIFATLALLTSLTAVTSAFLAIWGPDTYQTKFTETAITSIIITIALCFGWGFYNERNDW